MGGGASIDKIKQKVYNCTIYFYMEILYDL